VYASETVTFEDRNGEEGNPIPMTFLGDSFSRSSVSRVDSSTRERFFCSPEWFDILDKGFRAQSMLVGAPWGVAVTRFKVGPLALGYANFPIGLQSREQHSFLLAKETRALLRKAGVYILRWQVPVAVVPEILAKRVLPVTEIDDLQSWREDGLNPGVRYELRRSRREGLRIREARLEETDRLHALYVRTVSRHRGQVRYTLSYFTALLRLAVVGEKVQCYVGTPDKTDDAIGFIVTVEDGVAAYYLHGGFDRAHAALRPGYGLLAHAIQHAQHAGCRQFELLASPPGQHSLVRFKEQMGGSTVDSAVFDVPIGLAGSGILWSLRLWNSLRSAGG
jgi:hypothetical protein